ncbi:uncharacterized protein [Primulina eburnea]|uniref:uncharacterized protein n=1 Tax=Primulina eburnea TaxID=1245227 RepID=UPI003C6C432F
MFFDFLECTEEYRVKLIRHQLHEIAKSWWLVIKKALEQHGTVITWGIFIAEFYRRFFPVLYREEEAEFENLRQGQLKIDEYLTQFSILLRFAPHVARNDEAVVDQFLNGLIPEILILVNVERPNNLADALNRAKRAEAVLMRQKGASYVLPILKSQPLPSRFEIGGSSSGKKEQLKA